MACRLSAGRREAGAGSAQTAGIIAAMGIERYAEWVSDEAIVERTRGSTAG